MLNLGIVGYGNIGKGVKIAIENSLDCNLTAIFTRRNPDVLKASLSDVNIDSVDNINNYAGKIDVLILCGGSKSDLPIQSPQLAEKFNIVDSFDTHANIPQHLKNVSDAAKAGNHVAIISAGWDPGLFSMARLLFSSFLPNGKDYTFWGKGVSQGHSDAVRHIEGVADAIQYTIPVEKAIRRVRDGETPDFSTREKHTRLCYVVPKEGANKEKIIKEIKTMPNYFADYDTVVRFISREELKENHSKMSHGGSVLRSGATGDGTNKHVAELSLSLDSNPEFTGSIMVAFARAAAKLKENGKAGGFTAFDIPLSYLSPINRDELINNML